MGKTIEQIMGVHKVPGTGCPMCKGEHQISGKDCPRCFDPSRADVPGDVIGHVAPDGTHVRAVARIEDVPQYTL